MRRSLVSLVCAAVAIGGIAVAAGCGDDDGLSGDAVADVGNTEIAKSDFDRALSFVVGRGEDPRDRRACVDAKLRRLPSASHRAKSSEPELEQQCRKRYNELKSSVMGFLINAEWIRQEAEARQIALTDAEVTSAVDEARDGGLLTAAALRRAGVTAGQVIARIKQSRLQAKVTANITESSRKVSPRETADYYRRNRAKLIVPERRDLRIVITNSRAHAQAARVALERGRGWESVTRQFSRHVASRKTGGRIADLRGNSESGGVTGAVFRASKGKLVGPVKGKEKWAVFVVEKVKPSYQATFEQARDEIRELLTSRRRNRALAAFTSKYRDQTTCAPGFEVPGCKNGPRRLAGEQSRPSSGRAGRARQR